VLCLFILSCLGWETPVILPSSFSTSEPVIFTRSNRNFTTRIDLCNEGMKEYNNCTIVATANLPYKEWDFGSGNYVNFSIYSRSDGCNTKLCSNQPRAIQNRNVCTFQYTGNLGPYIYIVATSSAGVVSLVTTFNVNIDCSKKGTSYPNHPWTYDKRSVVQDDKCPTKLAQSTTFVSSIGVPQLTIPTSDQPNQAARFAFLVCSNQGDSSDIVLTVQAANKESAFATFICDSYNCDQNHANGDNWQDTSGASYNVIRPNSPIPAKVLYFSVFGWGAFGKFNSFTFDIVMRDWVNN